MKAAQSHGLKVWIESDLVSAWLTGPDAFNTAVQKIAAEADAVPDVVGVKIADELGKKDGSTTTPDQALQFLHDARAALHANVPGKLVLIDVIGYSLGCVPGSSAAQAAKCVDQANADHSAMTLDTIDRIVASGYVDAVDLTTNMNSPDKYQRLWNVSRADAQKAALAEAHRRGWDTKVILNTRKALSWPTSQDVQTPDQAAALVPDFIDVPLAAGLKGVDVWSWSQKWGKSGAIVHLMNPNYTTNALWDALVQRHSQGATLYVHYTPSYSEGSLDEDMAHIAQAFTGVFCAAGTG
jgi:hypothetical protein